MMKCLRLFMGYVLLIFSFYSYSQDDSIRHSCYQSMRYNVAVQMAGNAYTRGMRIKYTNEAFDYGESQGISKNETERMISIASNSSSSIQFSYQFQDDEYFAKGYMSGYLNDCMQNPKNYISQ